MKSCTRVFVDVPLRQRCNFQLPRPVQHRLKSVMRLRPSDTLHCFNGIDGEWVSEIVGSVSSQCWSLSPIECIRQQTSQPTLVAAIAPLKSSRMDYVVQKAVEMGATHITPILTDRTVARHPKPERMKSYAIAAAEQCGLLIVPEISDTIRLSQWIQQQRSAQNSCTFFACEAACQENLIQVLHNAPPTDMTEWNVLIGPEGGFSTEEIKQISDLPNTWSVKLGPRVMRADTALVAAMATLQLLRGDWRTDNN